MRERVKAAWWACVVWLYRARLDAFSKWMAYDVGFSGHGPTAFDGKPSVPRPRFPRWLQRRLDQVQTTEREWRQKCWREAVMETTGEDPNDWRGRHTGGER